MRPRTRIGHLIFELTEACNQRCRFCYNYWRDGRALDPPDPGLCRKTLRKLFSQAEIGNLYDRPLGEILSDPAVTEPYRAVPEACATCEKWTRCHGGCRAASEQVHGSFAAVDPVLDFS